MTNERCLLHVPLVLPLLRNGTVCMQAGKSDVLVATDVASKGLDFPDIQHVVNYDMPDEIENYVHRIGRTGRCGKTGIATSFINKNQSESILLDLKHLLVEAKQRLPPVLQVHIPTHPGNALSSFSTSSELQRRMHQLMYIIVAWLLIADGGWLVVFCYCQCATAAGGLAFHKEASMPAC